MMAAHGREPSCFQVELRCERCRPPPPLNLADAGTADSGPAGLAAFYVGGTASWSLH